MISVTLVDVATNAMTHKAVVVFDFLKNDAFVAIVAHGLIGISPIWEKGAAEKSGHGELLQPGWGMRGSCRNRTITAEATSKTTVLPSGAQPGYSLESRNFQLTDPSRPELDQYRARQRLFGQVLESPIQDSLSAAVRFGLP